MIVENAFSWVSENHEWQSIVNKHKLIYVQLLKSYTNNKS